MDDFVKNFLIENNLHNLHEKFEKHKRFSYYIDKAFMIEPENVYLGNEYVAKFLKGEVSIRKRAWSSCWSAKIWSRLYINTSLSAFIVVLIKTNNSSSVV
uniref:Uncharacterized protein n=1 Tax=Trichogramma kaykai TaxID=54128 RepID=A0ABD2XRB8_9HYME